MALEELGISRETVNRFIKAVSEDAFVLEDIAEQLELSISEARFILRYIIDHDIVRFKKIWVPIKKEKIEDK